MEQKGSKEYKELMEKAKMYEYQVDCLRTEAEHIRTVWIKKNGIEGWVGYCFQSSSSLTPEFSLFARQYKSALQKELKGYVLESWSRGHFEVSAFFKNIDTGKMVYISCSDVRHWQDCWYNNILIRTAEHNKDYTGGSNNYATLKELKRVADMLTQ